MLDISSAEAIEDTKLVNTLEESEVKTNQEMFEENLKETFFKAQAD